EKYREIYEKEEDPEPSYKDFFTEKDYEELQENEKKVNDRVEKALKRLREKIDEYYTKFSYKNRIVFVNCKTKKKKKLCLDIEFPSNKHEVESEEISKLSIVNYKRKEIFKMSSSSFKIVYNISAVIGAIIFSVITFILVVSGYLYITTKGKYFFLFLISGIIWAILFRIYLDLKDLFEYKFAIPFASTILFALWPLAFITSAIRDKKLVKLPLNFYVEIRSSQDGTNFVYYTKYETLCPICSSHSVYAKLKIKFDKKSKRFISVCEQNPSEHRFTFDYIALEGKRIEKSSI
ncbi:hypothetical protein, partial [Thermosulfurimonas dismutans]|uniref:hypothetical protein n=1 Tax=Thermosulfurimonas dismutans TaxID=999894 RepID=UPI001379BD47